MACVTIAHSVTVAPVSPNATSEVINALFAVYVIVTRMYLLVHYAGRFRY